MGVFDIFKKNSELEFLMDFDFIDNTAKKFHVKKIALETCIGLIARTIAQSDFRVKENQQLVKGELYYRLNIRPSLNVSASQFWESLIYKLILENEVLVIKTDSDDLLIADSLTRKEFAIYEDTFSDVIARGYPFKRVFKNSEVVYLTYQTSDSQV